MRATAVLLALLLGYRLDVELCDSKHCRPLASYPASGQYGCDSRAADLRDIRIGKRAVRAACVKVYRERLPV